MDLVTGAGAGYGDIGSCALTLRLGYGIDGEVVLVSGKYKRLYVVDEDYQKCPAVRAS
jgi:hypothetical protein